MELMFKSTEKYGPRTPPEGVNYNE